MYNINSTKNSNINYNLIFVCPNLNINTKPRHGFPSTVVAVKYLKIAL